MKKELLLIAAAATMLTACVNTEDFRDVNIQQNSENDGAIGFTSFTEKLTKGTAENSEALYTWTFYNHQESFQVWGRKSNMPTFEIFNGTTVNVSYEDTDEDGTEDTYFYRYSPSRFWDKTASKYYFFAAAPARLSSDAWFWTFNDDGINSEANLGKGHFTIEQTFSLNGVNLKHTGNGGADNALENVFKGVTLDGTANANSDIDLLIADQCEVENKYYNTAKPAAVNLNFIHLLSKLNVAIKTSLGTVNPSNNSAAHTYQVKLLAFDIQNVPNSSAGFDENKNGVGITANDKKEIRWDAPTGTGSILTGINGLVNNAIVDYDATTAPTGAIAVPGPDNANKLYIVESLIIPQEIEYERVALDGGAHEGIDEDAIPFTSYAAYEAARDNDVDRLNEAQFNALFQTRYTDFKTWSDYNSTYNINQATFNTNVTDATNNNNNDDPTDDYPYVSFAAYSEAKDNPSLTEEQFNALLATANTFKTWDNYNSTYVIDETTFNDRIKDATDVPAIDIDEYTAPTKTYFHIVYSIDDEVFEANYNLAAAFLNYNNNDKKFENGELVDLDNSDPQTFKFYEGWQNTLNIIINPTAIEFTADVAPWSTNEDVEYEIERGNENPNTPAP